MQEQHKLKLEVQAHILDRQPGAPYLAAPDLHLTPT